MEMGSQRHAQITLPPEKTRYPLCRRQGGPNCRSGRMRKISHPPGFDPRTVPPVPSAIPIELSRPTLSVRGVEKKIISKNSSTLNPTAFSNWYNISDSVVKNTLAGRVFKTQGSEPSANRRNAHAKSRAFLPSKIFGLSVETTNL